MGIFRSRDKRPIKVSDRAARREAVREAAQLRVLMVNGWRLV